MLKKNKFLLIVTSLVLLLPMVAGILLWDQLDTWLPIHWDIRGDTDKFATREFVVFGIPCILLALHWVCILFTAIDPKNKDIGGKPLALVLWICPIMALLVCGLLYIPQVTPYGFGPSMFIPMVLGILFLFIGNYLPKCKQNYTIGIKVPWALADEGNWNATHRFAGKVWVIGSLLILVNSLFGVEWPIPSTCVLLAILLVMCIAPAIYSYVYYRKHKED